MPYDDAEFASAFREAEPRGAPGARRRSPETWGRVREGYLAGVSAPELCARFGVGLTALRVRAREEGWRRADAPDPEPTAPAADLDTGLDDDPLSARDMAYLAWRRLSLAVRQGRLADALGWERLMRQLRRLSREEARQLAEWSAAAAAEPHDPHDPHDPHAGTECASLSPSPDAGAGETPDVGGWAPGPAVGGLEEDTSRRPLRHAAAPRATSPEIGGGLEPHAGTAHAPRPTGPPLPPAPPAWARAGLGMR